MNALLFDDDCGPCTKFAFFISRLIAIPIIPMHNEKLMSKGIELIGYDKYWQSFHIMEDDKISTDEDAIIALAGYFPLGEFGKKIAKTPIVLKLLLFVLNRLKKIRNNSCTP